MKRSAFFIVWRRLYSTGTLSSWPWVTSMKKPCTRLNSTRRLAMPVRSRSRFSISRRKAPQSFWIARSSSSSASKPSRITPPSRITAAGSSLQRRGEARVRSRRGRERPRGAPAAPGWPLCVERGVQRGQRRERVAQAREVARARGAKRHARGDALHVGPAAKSSPRCADGARRDGGSSSAAIASWRRASTRGVAQRMVQPVAQPPAAHRGRAAVEQREERGRLGAARSSR